MKKKLVFLLICMFVISFASFLLTRKPLKEETQNNIKIVTSFYPTYIITKNLVDNIEHIELVNLTEYDTGCLHNYQLTTQDMKRLEDADLFIMNGGGMESFMGDILASNPDLPIIDASEGLSLLPGSGHNHHEVDRDHEGHEEDSASNHDLDHSHEYNAHVWLNMDYYKEQIKNIQMELEKYDPEHKLIYEKNAERYIDEITQLQEEYLVSLEPYKDIPIVLFHDAFVYLAQEMGLNMVHAIDMDSDTYFSASQISEIINIIKKEQVKILLIDSQYNTLIAERIASESNAKVYKVNTIVQGEFVKEAYITGMKDNLEILIEAYKDYWRDYE